MKLHALILTVSFWLLNSGLLYSQSGNPPGYVIKIKTDNGTLRGLLTGIMDSSIEVKSKRLYDKKIVAVSSIQMIKVKKPFIKNVTSDLMLGSLSGAALIVIYYVNNYLKNYSFYPDDPTFGRALWQTMAVGACAGVIYGSIESAFIRVKIPIYKAQYMFENKRTRLAKYLSY